MRSLESRVSQIFQLASDAALPRNQKGFVIHNWMSRINGAWSDRDVPPWLMKLRPFAESMYSAIRILTAGLASAWSNLEILPLKEM